MKRIFPPWCIAHRGARQEAPDNSASALKRALTYPIDGIEFDVQMSADGVPILFHDRTLWKLMRQRKRVSELTLIELHQLDWGAWFHPDFAGEPVLTLQDALVLVRQCPRLLIEIKSNPHGRRTGHVAMLTEQVISLVKNTVSPFAGDRIFILSFDPKVLDSAHGLAPEFHHVLNISEDDPATLTALPNALIRKLWAVDIDINKLSMEWVRCVRRQKLHLMTYTCNRARQVQKALDLGVEAIISDRPGWLARLLKQGKCG